MEEAKPAKVGLRPATETGEPGEFIFMSDAVYLIKADGSWEKLSAEMAAVVRKEMGR